jgi:hypothetical protein
MHVSFTRIFSNNVMGRVPLVRFSSSFTTRANPSQGHLSSSHLARIISLRMSSRNPINLPPLAVPVRHLWGSQPPRVRLPLQAFADEQEEAIKSNLLETAYKGRQPGDMMLRCNFSPHSCQCSMLITNFDNRHHS